MARKPPHSIRYTVQFKLSDGTITELLHYETMQMIGYAIERRDAVEALIWNGEHTDVTGMAVSRRATRGPRGGLVVEKLVRE